MIGKRRSGYGELERWLQEEVLVSLKGRQHKSVSDAIERVRMAHAVLYSDVHIDMLDTVRLQFEAEAEHSEAVALLHSSGTKQRNFR